MDSKLSLSAKRQLWREHYDEFKESGLTQADYCRNNGLPVKALSYWVRKYRREEKVPSRQQWSALTVSGAPENSYHQQMTVQMDKIQLRIPSGFDQETIACVIGLLRD